MKQVRFSRFEHIYRYPWIAPVNGFQTKKEYKNALTNICYVISTS